MRRGSQSYKSSIKILTNEFLESFLFNSQEQVDSSDGQFFSIFVRRGSHQGESLQNGLGDERTCGTTLALAYVLYHLSAAWLQLQMREKKSERK